jgi:hypothetical protein
MRNKTYTIGSDIRGERQIHLNGKNSNFTAAYSTRYSPEKGLSTGHIISSDYFNDLA